MQLVAAAITAALGRALALPGARPPGRPGCHRRRELRAARLPAGAATRDARYTRYVDDTHGCCARTPRPWCRPPCGGWPAATEDVVVACPGLVYRRDVVDRLHVGEPHQLDLWRIRRGPPLDRRDLDEMIGWSSRRCCPAAAIARSRRRTPTPTDGLEVEVRGRRGVGRAARVRPGRRPRAARGRARPRRWSGLALGLGLDRALMLRKGMAISASCEATTPGSPPDADARALPGGQLDAGDAARPVDRGRRRRLRRRAGRPDARQPRPGRARALEEMAVVAETPAGELPRPRPSPDRPAAGPEERAAPAGAPAPDAARSRPRRPTARGIGSTRRCTRATSTSGRAPGGRRPGAPRPPRPSWARCPRRRSSSSRTFSDDLESLCPSDLPSETPRLLPPPVVGRVEARALEVDRDRMQHPLCGRAAHLALGERVVRELLEHLEAVVVLASVLVDRHLKASYTSTGTPGTLRPGVPTRATG